MCVGGFLLLLQGVGVLWNFHDLVVKSPMSMVSEGKLNSNWILDIKTHSDEDEIFCSQDSTPKACAESKYLIVLHSFPLIAKLQIKPK